MKKFLVPFLVLVFAAAPLVAVTAKKTVHKKTAAAAESSPTPRKKHVTPTPEPDDEPTPGAARKKKHPAVSPSPTPDEEEAPLPKKKSSPTPTPEVSASPEEKNTREAAPNATLSPQELVEFSKQPAKVQRLLEAGLALTQQNLTYTYGSADPGNGGMDCSGFVYHVLREQQFTDVPRSASEQYVWVRKAGKFFAVLGRKNETFELDDLRPGDLLFWTGTYKSEHDPPITHAMIYLGKEKRTGKRVMVGSSDGRSYDGKSRWGVSVFDFAVESRDSANGSGPRFVGYARIPGLGAGE